MSSASYGLVLIFLAAGCALGWYANRAYAAHGDVKSTKRKIPGFRKSRHRNSIITFILAFVICVVVYDIIRVRH
ncbi:MAG TPA: hypothetical protein VN840_06065 [Streptosporangiaceae bacterium]|nr:hypothetical protein [Streptosporangiaceae bacterium]